MKRGTIYLSQDVPEITDIGKLAGGCVGEPTGDTDPECELVSTKITKPQKQRGIGMILQQIISDVTTSCENVPERLKKLGDSNLSIAELHRQICASLMVWSRGSLNTLLMSVMRDTIMFELDQNYLKLDAKRFTVVESQSSSMLYSDEIVIGMRSKPGIITIVMALIPNGTKNVKDEENEVIKMAKLNIMVRTALRNQYGNDVSVVDPINEIPCVQLSREESNPDACPGPIVGEIIPCNN